MGICIAEQNDFLDPLNPMRIDVLLRITTNSELPNDIRANSSKCINLQ